MSSPKNCTMKLFLWGGPVHRDRLPGQHGLVIAIRAAIGRRLPLMPSPVAAGKRENYAGRRKLGPLAKRRKAMSGARHAMLTSLRSILG